MIKAAGSIGDLPLLIVGLSAENTRRLLDDQPIKFETGPLGLPNMVVVIVGGETEEAIAAQLDTARILAGQEKP